MPLPVIGGVIGALGATGLFKVAVAWFIANVACKLIFRTMFALGIGLITYTLADELLDGVLAIMQDSLFINHTLVRSFFATMHLDVVLGIIFSAATYAIVFRFTSKAIGFVGRNQGVSGSQIWR